MALWMMVAAAVGCAEPVQISKQRLITAMRHAILESVAAEKSAVLATTDEESQSLARETQRFAADVDRLRGELRKRVVADGRPQEIEKLDAFDAAWAEVESVDQRLLALAVANTNLKAAQLSARDGARAVDRLVDGLAELQRTTADPETIRTLGRASVAALRVQSLVLVHIPAANDEEMTRLEQQMRGLNDEVARALVTVRESGQLSQEQLAAVSQAWRDYGRVVADVLALSRENTNVLSFDVSIHEKRHATKDCLAALEALSAAVSSGTEATR